MPRWPDALVARALADWFGIQPATCRVLMVLYRSKVSLDHPTLKTRARLTGVYHALNVRISDLRKAMAPGSIGHDGQGWSLTPTGRMEYRTALSVLWDVVASDLQSIS